MKCSSIKWLVILTARGILREGKGKCNLHNKRVLSVCFKVFRNSTCATSSSSTRWTRNSVLNGISSSNNLFKCKRETCMILVPRNSSLTIRQNCSVTGENLAINHDCSDRSVLKKYAQWWMFHYFVLIYQTQTHIRTSWLPSTLSALRCTVDVIFWISQTSSKFAQR